MPKLEVFDPAMCCSTGVCGPAVDPVMPRFAADLDWLKSQGVGVERFNLAQQPGIFANKDIVKQALSENGTDCLPLISVDGRMVSRGAYPGRDQLAAFIGLNRREEETPRLRQPVADRMLHRPRTSRRFEREAAARKDGG